MKKRSVKAVAAVMAVLMIGTFAACKKDPEDAVGSTSEESSRNAWLDETLATEAALSEIVTDENGETRVIEYETDASGTVVTAPDGKKVTKPAATEAAATTAASTTATQPQGGGFGWQ